MPVNPPNRRINSHQNGYRRPLNGGKPDKRSNVMRLGIVSVWIDLLRCSGLPASRVALKASGHPGTLLDHLPQHFFHEFRRSRADNAVAAHRRHSVMHVAAEHVVDDAGLVKDAAVGDGRIRRDQLDGRNADFLTRRNFSD